MSTSMDTPIAHSDIDDRHQVDSAARSLDLDVAIQALSAGFLSGTAVAAGRSPVAAAPRTAWVARAGMVLFVIVVLQVGAGYTRRYWLHVPLGVGLFGGLIRQTSRLDALWRATGARS